MDMELGERIKERRQLAGLTQEELAERIHTTRQTVSNYELGNSEPRLEVLRDIAEALGCGLDTLVSDETAAGAGRETDKADLDQPSARRPLIAVIALIAAEFVILQFIDPAVNAYVGRTYDTSLRMISVFVVQNLIMLFIGFFAVRLAFAALRRPRPAAPRLVKIIVIAAATVLAFIHIWALIEFLHMHFEFSSLASLPAQEGGWSYSSQTSGVTDLLMIPLAWLNFRAFSYRLAGILIGEVLGLFDLRT